MANKECRSMTLFAGMACLASLVWWSAGNSFTSAAPAVPRHEAVPSHDSPADRHVGHCQPEVHEAKQRGPKAAKEPAAQKRFSDLQIVQRGQKLYRSAGCVRCHGPKGKGGVRNPNYIDGTFPRLDNMATKLSLRFPEDVEVVVDLLAAGKTLNDPSKIDVWKPGVVAARYRIIANTIANGSQAAKKDPQGPDPTGMPPFKDVLTESEISQLLASFLVLSRVDEEE
jgi:cytochrome c553